MPVVIDVDVAKNQLEGLVERAHRGESVFLELPGSARVQLVPVDAAHGTRTPGRLKGWVVDHDFFAACPEAFEDSGSVEPRQDELGQRGEADASRRIGHAKGRFVLPDDLCEPDVEVEQLFLGSKRLD